MDLIRKVCYVDGGHLKDPNFHMTYAIIVSWYSECIALIVAAINTLYVVDADIHNAYLNDTTKDKFYFYAGDKWKSERDRIVLIVWAIYGHKY